MKYYRFTIRIIASLLSLLIFSCCSRTVEPNGIASTSGTINLAISFETSSSDVIGVTSTTRAAVADDYTDPYLDPYIHSLWVVIFNSDGSRYAEPMNIFDDLKGGSVLYWTYPHDLNYDEEQHIYFITNVEDAGILDKLKQVQDEAGIKALKWGLESAKISDPKDLYTCAKYPKVRMLVASYALGVQSKNDGGKIYYKRLAPVGFEDTDVHYAKDTPTFNGLIEVKLVRTYSSINVEMQQDKDLDRIYKELYNREVGLYTTFSFRGYAKEYSIFGTTESPEDETTVLPVVDHEIKIFGNDSQVTWDSELKGTLKFYFPSTSQNEKNESMTVSSFNNKGQEITRVVEYKEPCLDITYRHRENPHHIFVNAKNGEIFKPNYNYKLPITFYPPKYDIWIVAVRNILKSEAQDITIQEVQNQNWESRTFANELHYGEEKPHDIPSVGNDKKLYSDATVFYGNMYSYSTVIETMSLGAPAVVPDKENLPAWIKDIEEKEVRTFNDGNMLFYVQLWVLNPREIQEDNTRLRGVIPFRNKFFDVIEQTEEVKAENDVHVYASFNVLARFTSMDLGDLNTFANGKTKEYDPYSNEPLFTEMDEGLDGKIYQFGRNIPLDYEKFKDSNHKEFKSFNVDLETGNIGDHIPKIWQNDYKTILPMNSTKFHYMQDAPWWRYGDPQKKIEEIPAEKEKFEDNPWSWIVNRTYEVYHDKYASLTKAYVGNNGGDPCPGSDTRYPYYQLPKRTDMSLVFYNDVGPYNSDQGAYTKIITLLDLAVEYEGEEKDVNPGGDPNSPDLQKKFKAYYYRKGGNRGPAYAVRYIGTKWESFYIYQDTTRGGKKGLLVTVAPTPDGMTLDDIKTIVREGKVMEEINKRKHEISQRFFSYSPLFIFMMNNEISMFQLANQSYTDYTSNTVIWVDINTTEKPNAQHYAVFDIDVQGYSDKGIKRILTGSAAGLNIRCIRR